MYQFKNKDIKINDFYYFCDTMFCILVEVLNLKKDKAEITPVAGIQDRNWVNINRLYKKVKL